MIRSVQNFKYLGSMVQEKKIAAVAAVQSRIGQEAAVFASLKWCMWKKADITFAIKMRLFRSLIIPILLYGSETLTLLKMEINKLEIFQMQCLRQILDISRLDRLRNETVRQQYGNQPTIEEAIQKRRLQWFGHVCRMDISRLLYKLLWRQRPPTGKVHRRAPKKTWVKQVEDRLKNRCLTLVDAETLSTDRLAWGQVVGVAGRPSAPTAEYELSRRLWHNAS